VRSDSFPQWSLFSRSSFPSVHFHSLAIPVQPL
jgi:hypothetical protein